jgi:aryl-alcohol dehydrogenase-like predicted oxidoreductase
MKPSTLSPNQKALVLGTALWGWGINRRNAYQLLERFLRNGGSMVDTATNYPINKRDKDFGLAIRWIADWIELNNDSKLSLIVKIGSIDNMGSQNVDLRPESIIKSANNLRDLFAEALYCISVHWDDRDGGEVQMRSIDQTVKAMADLEKSGLAVGMSGIRHPDLYYKAAPALANKWIIQVKENFITSQARESYQPFFPDAAYLAYGINLGGIKTGSLKQDSSIRLRKINIPDLLVEKLSAVLDSDHDFVPRPTSLNELALAKAYANPALSGVIIGPRNVEQLDNAMQYWDRLKQQAKGSESRKAFDKLFA